MRPVRPVRPLERREWLRCPRVVLEPRPEPVLERDRARDEPVLCLRWLLALPPLRATEERVREALRVPDLDLDPEVDLFRDWLRLFDFEAVLPREVLRDLGLVFDSEVRPREVLRDLGLVFDTEDRFRDWLRLLDPEVVRLRDWLRLLDTEVERLRDWLRLLDCEVVLPRVVLLDLGLVFDSEADLPRVEVFETELPLALRDADLVREVLGVFDEVRTADRLRDLPAAGETDLSREALRDAVEEDLAREVLRTSVLPRVAAPC